MTTFKRRKPTSTIVYLSFGLTNTKKTVGDWSSRPGPAILMADISKFTLKGIFVYSHESELPAVACSLWQLRQVSLLQPARPRIRLD